MILALLIVESKCEAVSDSTDSLEMFLSGGYCISPKTIDQQQLAFAQPCEMLVCRGRLSPPSQGCQLVSTLRHCGNIQSVLW